MQRDLSACYNAQSAASQSTAIKSDNSQAACAEGIHHFLRLHPPCFQADYFAPFVNQPSTLVRPAIRLRRSMLQSLAAPATAERPTEGIQSLEEPASRPYIIISTCACIPLFLRLSREEQLVALGSLIVDSEGGSSQTSQPRLHQDIQKYGRWSGRKIIFGGWSSR